MINKKASNSGSKLLGKIRTKSGNWFELLSKLIEGLLCVNKFKLPGLQ
jgi:hypothetical protein